MPLPLLTLPCTVCGGIAVQLRPPELPADVRGFLVPLVKLASLKFAPTQPRLEVPKNGNLFELIGPETLAQLLELRCYTCKLTPALEAAATHGG